MSQPNGGKTWITNAGVSNLYQRMVIAKKLFQ